jgi:hypothetical protein
MKTTIDFLDTQYDIELVTNRYRSTNNLVIQAVCDDGELFGTVTTNVENQLEENEIAVKTYSENSWAPQLLEKLPEVFKDTGKRIPSGFVNVHIWTCKVR